MAEALRRRHLAVQLSWAAIILSIGAALAALAAAVGAGQGAWGFRTGFSVIRYAVYGATLGGLVALAGLWMASRASAHGLSRLNLLALAVAVVFLAYVGNQVVAARSVPAIHDVTTNLDDVPSFYRLRVRDDNLAQVPDLGRPPLMRMSPRERWKAVHRQGYPDLATIRVPWSVAETTDRAEALARDRGWEVVTEDSTNGIMEAVATSRLFRFKDNVVVRARKAPADEGTLVDMRSISRVGVSDRGANARRIRAFLKDLQAGKAA